MGLNPFTVTPLSWFVWVIAQVQAILTSRGHYDFICQGIKYRPWQNVQVTVLKSCTYERVLQYLSYCTPHHAIISSDKIIIELWCKRQLWKEKERVNFKSFWRWHFFNYLMFWWVNIVFEGNFQNFNVVCKVDNVHHLSLMDIKAKK